jgi:dihydroneopterin aldolase
LRHRAFGAPKERALCSNAAVAHHDWIRTSGLEVDCVVGVYPHERDTPQPLRLDVELCLDTEAAAKRERLRRTVDYAALTAQLAFLLRSARFRMLETAAHALARYVLAPPAPGERRAAVERARITLTKPTALGGAAVPSLTIERDAAWVELTQEQKPFGTVDVIHETRDAGIYRLNVAPGHVIPLHVHRVMQEAEMVLSDGLLCQGMPVRAGTVHRWPKDAAHGYKNPTRRHQTILCVDSPPFIPEDEVAVSGEPAHVPADTR